MNYIKAKFLKGDKPSGRAYTYRAEEELNPGDMVTDAKGSKLVVVDEPVDSAWIMAFGADKLAVVGKYVEPTTLKIGDKVIANGKYGSVEENKGKIFTVRSEPFSVCGTESVLLEEYSGCCAVDGLDKCEESANEAEPM